MPQFIEGLNRSQQIKQPQADVCVREQHGERLPALELFINKNRDDGRTCYPRTDTEAVDRVNDMQGAELSV